MVLARQRQLMQIAIHSCKLIHSFTFLCNIWCYNVGTWHRCKSDKFLSLTFSVSFFFYFIFFKFKFCFYFGVFLCAKGSCNWKDVRLQEVGEEENKEAQRWKYGVDWEANFAENQFALCRQSGLCLWDEGCSMSRSYHYERWVDILQLIQK